MAKNSRTERIKITIAEIDGRWLYDLGDGIARGGFREKSGVYVALSDYFIQRAKLLNPEAREQR